jgi:hypothetical protein
MDPGELALKIAEMAKDALVSLEKQESTPPKERLGTPILLQVAARQRADYVKRLGAAADLYSKALDQVRHCETTAAAADDARQSSATTELALARARLREAEKQLQDVMEEKPPSTLPGPLKPRARRRGRLFVAVGTAVSIGLLGLYVAERSRAIGDAPARPVGSAASQKASAATKPLIFVGSGTVLNWMRANAHGAYKRIDFDLKGNTYTGVNVLRDSAEHGRFVADRSYGMILGTSDEPDRVWPSLFNKNEPDNVYYKVPLGNAVVYAYVYPNRPASDALCPDTHRRVDDLLSTQCVDGKFCVTLEQLADCILTKGAPSTAVRALVPGPLSGTRSLIVSELSRARASKNGDASTTKEAIDAELSARTTSWDQTRSSLTDHHLLQSVGSIVVGIGSVLLDETNDDKDDTCASPGSNCRRVAVCQRIGSDKTCVPLSRPLMIWGKFDPKTSTVDPGECAFIRSVVEAANLGAISTDCHVPIVNPETAAQYPFPP